MSVPVSQVTLQDSRHAGHRVSCHLCVACLWETAYSKWHGSESYPMRMMTWGQKNVDAQPSTVLLYIKKEMTSWISASTATGRGCPKTGCWRPPSEQKDFLPSLLLDKLLSQQLEGEMKMVHPASSCCRDLHGNTEQFHGYAGYYYLPVVKAAGEDSTVRTLLKKGHMHTCTNSQPHLHRLIRFQMLPAHAPPSMEQSLSDHCRSTAISRVTRELSFLGVEHWELELQREAK